MESTDFESHIHLLRDLRCQALLTAECAGVYRQWQQYVSSRTQGFANDLLDTVNQCGKCLSKITTLVEELALSGRGFPVSLRMEIEDQLAPYYDHWVSNSVTTDSAASSLDTLQKIYDDLSLHACVDSENIVSTLELVHANNAITEPVGLASIVQEPNRTQNQQEQANSPA